MRSPWSPHPTTWSGFEAASKVIRIISAQGGSFGAKLLQSTVETMKKHYDFSKAKLNPYAKRLKKEVTLRLNERTLEYFEALSEETGIPYCALINLYLRECTANRKRLAIQWKPAA
jgi:predicted DNA binding CopG/RHH family protein